VVHCDHDPPARQHPDALDPGQVRDLSGPGTCGVDGHPRLHVDLLAAARVAQADTGDGVVVATWGLIDVVPVRWTGPSLNPDSPKVATETVEIAHHGFLHTPASAVNSNGQN